MRQTNREILKELDHLISKKDTFSAEEYVFRLEELKRRLQQSISNELDSNISQRNILMSVNTILNNN